MADVCIVAKRFSARHWSRVPHKYEDFEAGDRLISIRAESGDSIFARESDPIGRYIVGTERFEDCTRPAAVV